MKKPDYKWRLLAFLRLLSLGRISLDGFADEVHPISDAPEVYARLGAGGAFPVVQFDWADQDAGKTPDL